MAPTVRVIAISYYLKPGDLELGYPKAMGFSIESLEPDMFSTVAGCLTMEAGTNGGGKWNSYGSRTTALLRAQQFEVLIKRQSSCRCAAVTLHSTAKDQYDVYPAVLPTMTASSALRHQPTAKKNHLAQTIKWTTKYT